ncbi:small integral membrane protein 20-like [Penaeus monodon]|uniref:small integral membrane protein 20-like n=1 Tax=Penaeus monodon TaxID=6687 RepID=UPI0018A77B20|nr:small integral membrane protein 20-like [Penaeus monodon]
MVLVNPPYLSDEVHKRKPSLLSANTSQGTIRNVYLRGWRYGLFLGGLVGFISAALYPIIIYPMMHVDDYKKIQAENRKDVNQEEIQPGNMKVWSDPFDRKK